MTTASRRVPEAFTGGWQRVSISLGAAAPHEDMNVWWLQTATKHADLRIPLGIADPSAEQCVSFAGTTTWEDPWLTWTPELTLLPSEEVDTGATSWDGADLIEAGTSDVQGASVAYVERWRRIPGTTQPQAALSSPGGRLVRTGSRALTILDGRPQGGAYCAVAWRLREGTWVVDHAWPAGARAPAPPPAIRGPSVRLADGNVWSVDEVSPDHA